MYHGLPPSADLLLGWAFVDAQMGDWTLLPAALDLHMSAVNATRATMTSTELLERWRNCAQAWCATEDFYTYGVESSFGGVFPRQYMPYEKDRRAIVASGLDVRLSTPYQAIVAYLRQHAKVPPHYWEWIDSGKPGCDKSCPALAGFGRYLAAQAA